MSRSTSRVVFPPIFAALILGLGAFAAAQELRVSPATKSVSLGEDFSISIEVADIVDLYGFQFDVHYNPAVVEYRGYSYGPFLSRNGQDPTFPMPPTVSPGLLHNCV